MKQRPRNVLRSRRFPGVFVCWWSITNLIRFVRQMLPFCKEWKDRCVWFTYFQKIPTFANQLWCVFLRSAGKKSSSPAYWNPAVSVQPEKVGVFPWEVQPKKIASFTLRGLFREMLRPQTPAGNPTGDMQGSGWDLETWHFFLGVWNVSCERILEWFQIISSRPLLFPA